MSRPARIFGVTSTLSGLNDGIIANSMSFNNNVDVAEARDEKGKLLDLAPYSKTEEVSIDGLFTAAGAEVGTVVQLNGKDYLISNVTKTENNTEFQTASVTCRGGDDDTVVWPLSSIQQSE